MGFGCYLVKYYQWSPHQNASVPTDESSVFAMANPQVNCVQTVDDIHRNLMVNYIPEAWTQVELQNLFQQYGEIESCTVVINKQTQTSKGYGFVKFFHRADAESALEALNGYQIENRFAPCGSHYLPVASARRFVLFACPQPSRPLGQSIAFLNLGRWGSKKPNLAKVLPGQRAFTLPALHQRSFRKLRCNKSFRNLVLCRE